MKGVLAACTVVLLCTTARATTDWAFMEAAQKNKAHELAVWVSSHRAMCRLTPDEDSKSKKIHKVAISRAVEELNAPPDQVRQSVADLASGISSAMVKAGQDEPECALYRAWLVNVE